MLLPMVRSWIFAAAIQGAGALSMISMRAFGNTSAVQVSDDDSTASRSRPHLLIILADDMGYNGIGYNNDAIQTPHIDKLARGGIMLKAFYAASICAPSRFSLLTGRNAWKSEGFGSENLHPSYPVGTDPGYDMLPKVLQKAGYKTHAIGKWHQGFHKPEYLPTARGFDSFYGILEGSSDHFSQYSETWRCNGVEVIDFTIDDEPGLTGTDWDKETNLGDTKYRAHAEKIIWDHDVDHPLFMYLSLQFPHSPFQVSDDYKAKYQLSAELQIYYGMISHLDDTVGGVTKALQEKKMWDNTVVVFLSDNGAEASAPDNANLPFSGHKGQVLEGGIRVPAFVTGGYLPDSASGRQLTGLVSIADWSVTFAGLGGAAKQFGKGPMPVDGVNVWDYISGKRDNSTRDRVIQLHPSTSWMGGANTADGCRPGGPTFSLHYGKWKLIQMGLLDENLMRVAKTGKNICSESPCLFDMEADEKEEHDVSEDNHGIVAKMASMVNKEMQVAIDSHWFGRVFQQAGTVDQDHACIAFTQSDGKYKYITPWANAEYTNAYLAKSVKCKDRLIVVASPSEQEENPSLVADHPH